MLEITSKDNTKIKDYKKLCTSRKHRLQTERFVLEGARLVCDALKSGANIHTLFVTQAGIARLDADFAKLAAQSEIVLISDAMAAYMAETETPQGVFAVCSGRLFNQHLPDDANNGILMLCSLQDPGNVGTILRSADAFGLSAVVMTADCPEPDAPKVLRASMGAALRVPVYVTEDAVAAISQLKLSGITVYAAALGEQSLPIDGVSLTNSAVVIGNEGAGIPDKVLSACDSRVVLPISAQSESLNAAMAATVFAWELSQAARRDKGGVSQ